MHPISYLQAIVLGLLQGVAEPFPISSLGHAVILPRLLGWDIHQNDDYFLTFLVATHLATAIVLLRHLLRRLAADRRRACWRSLRDREIAPDDGDARLGWLLVVGTIPAGILGLLLEHPLRTLFASAPSAAAFLILNGVLLLGFERLRRSAPAFGEEPSDERIARLSWRQAIAVGTSQAAALIPGISRSGVTMGGGLLVGLSNEDAARYRLPARHADHRRGRAAEAARPLRRQGRRGPRPGAAWPRCAPPSRPTSRCASCCATSRPTA